MTKALLYAGLLGACASMAQAIEPFDTNQNYAFGGADETPANTPKLAGKTVATYRTNWAAPFPGSNTHGVKGTLQAKVILSNATQALNFEYKFTDIDFILPPKSCVGLSSFEWSEFGQLAYEGSNTFPDQMYFSDVHIYWNQALGDHFFSEIWGDAGTKGSLNEALEQDGALVMLKSVQNAQTNAFTVLTNYKRALATGEARLLVTFYQNVTDDRCSTQTTSGQWVEFPVMPMGRDTLPKLNPNAVAQGDVDRRISSWRSYWDADEGSVVEMTLAPARPRVAPLATLKDPYNPYAPVEIIPGILPGTLGILEPGPAPD